LTVAQDVWMTIENTEPGRSKVRYLLGEMSEAQRAAFEDRYLNDSSLFYELVELETDLIDLYAFGELSAADQRRLERSFLADPVRRQRLVIARALGPHALPEAADSGDQMRRPRVWQSARAVRLAAAALALITLPLIAWLFIVDYRLNDEIGALRQEQANAQLRARLLQQRVEELNRVVANGGREDTVASPVDTKGQVIAAFTLKGDVLRGSGDAPKLHAPELYIPASAGMIQLNLLFRMGSLSSYILTLETGDGVHAWGPERCKSRTVRGESKQVSFRIPARALKNGDYVLRLAADGGDEAEDVAVYSFQVKRR
jgi:hypothetical protein